MSRYKPSKKFDVPMLLYVVTGTENKMGVPVKTYDTEGRLFWGSFASYGGTETQVNGLLSVQDTATVETYFRPDFASSARVALANDPKKLYEIVGEPENIEQRNHYCKFKVTRVKGGA